MKHLRRKGLLVAITLCSLSGLNSFAQPRKAIITSVQARTQEGVIIQVSNRKDIYKLGEDIIIDYIVRNTGPKSIFLVTDAELKLWAKNDVLWLESPIKYADEFQPYN